MALGRRNMAMIAAGLMALTCILYIVSNALASWGHFDAFGTAVNAGLWRLCFSVRGQEICGSYTCDDISVGNDCTKLYAARAFMTVACIFSGFATLSILLNLANTGANQRLVASGRNFPGATLLPGIIGVAMGIVFVTTANFGLNVTLKIGAAAAIGIVALVLNLIAGITAAMVPSTN